MKVFITDLSQTINSAHQFEQHIQLLSPQDKDRYVKIKNPQRALQFLTGRLLIAEHIQGSIQTLPCGKVVSDKLFLSLTHTKNYVMLALSENPVGIDIEDITVYRDYKKIAKRLGFFPPSNATDFYLQFTQYEADFKLGDRSKKIYHQFYKYQNLIICLSSLSSFDFDVCFFQSTPFELTSAVPSSSLCRIDL